MNSIGKQIKTLRLKHHMTQQELADQLHVTNKTISKWETSRNLPDIEMIGEIAKLFHISVDELITQRKGLKNKTKTLLKILFIEMIIFVFVLLLIYDQRDIRLYDFVLSFALPNVIILAIACAVSYFVDVYYSWLKVFKYLIYTAIICYDLIFVLSLLPLGLGLFVKPGDPLVFYSIVLVFGILIGL